MVKSILSALCSLSIDDRIAASNAEIDMDVFITFQAYTTATSNTFVELERGANHEILG